MNTPCCTNGSCAWCELDKVIRTILPIPRRRLFVHMDDLERIETALSGYTGIEIIGTNFVLNPGEAFLWTETDEPSEIGSLLNGIADMMGRI